MDIGAILSDIQALGDSIGAKFGVPVGPRMAVDAEGGAVLWLDAVPPSGRIALAYLRPGREVKAQYVVGRIGNSHVPRRCASKAHALRVLADETIKVLQQVDPRDFEPDEAPSPTAAEQPADADEAPAPQKSPAPPAAPVRAPTVPEQPQTFTADEAVAHPVIRAAVIASHEIAKTTGTTPDPAMVRAMANAALAVVDTLWPYYARKDDGPEFIEHLLIGTLTGALTAARNRPG